MKIKKKQIKKKNIPNLFVISGKSGAGKSTLIKALCKMFDKFKKVVPYTTRDPRPGEVEGSDYNFVSKEHFIESNEIICKKQNGSAYYGLPKDLVGNILDLDPEGILNLRRELPNSNIIVIALEQPLLIRMWRMFKRGDKMSSIIARICHDKKAFRSLDEMADFICYPNGAKACEIAISIWDNIISKMI